MSDFPKVVSAITHMVFQKVVITVFLDDGSVFEKVGRGGDWVKQTSVPDTIAGEAYEEPIV